MTTPRLTPPMRALLECSGCLAHGSPIPLTLLYTATDAERNFDIKPALQQLVRIGFFRHMDKTHVAITADGHRFLAERQRSGRTRDAVELATLITANQLIEAKDWEQLAALEKHLAALVDVAMPRADDKAAMLTGTFLLSLMHLKAFDTIRDYVPRVQALENASGFSILSDEIAARFTGKSGGSVTLSQAMLTILQSIACMDDDQPVPLSLFYIMFEPRLETEKAVNELVEQGYVIRQNAHMILLTESGKRLYTPTADPDLCETVVSGMVTLVKTAQAEDDKATLRQVKPHLETMVAASLTQADDTAHQTLITMIHCLIGLGEMHQAAVYVDQAEELEAAMGIGAETPTGEDKGGGERSEQYHAQVAVHYFQQKDFGRAKQHFEKVITMTDDPKLIPLLYQKVGNCCGMLGDELGKIQAYVTALDRALAYHGRDSWELTRHRNELALVFMEYGQPETAARHIQEAIHQAERANIATFDYFRETAKAHLLAAKLAYQRGDRNQGGANVDRALTLIAELGDDWVSQVHLWYMTGSLLFQNGLADMARPIVKRAWRLCENNSPPSDSETVALIGLLSDLRGHLTS